MKPAMSGYSRRKPPSVEPAAGGTVADFVSTRRAGLGAVAVVVAALAAGGLLSFIAKPAVRCPFRSRTCL